LTISDFLLPLEPIPQIPSPGKGAPFFYAWRIGSAGSVDVLHDPGKVPERGLDHQVEVLAHKTIGVGDCTAPLPRR
jgi:hypothetical protein